MRDSILGCQECAALPLEACRKDDTIDVGFIRNPSTGLDFCLVVKCGNAMDEAVPLREQLFAQMMKWDEA